MQVEPASEAASDCEDIRPDMPPSGECNSKIVETPAKIATQLKRASYSTPTSSLLDSGLTRARTGGLRPTKKVRLGVSFGSVGDGRSLSCVMACLCVRTTRGVMTTYETTLCDRAAHQRAAQLRSSRATYSNRRWLSHAEPQKLCCSRRRSCHHRGKTLAAALAPFVEKDLSSSG